MQLPNSTGLEALSTMTLATGGEAPGVHVLQSERDAVARVLSLPEGATPYAVALSGDGSSLAQGTRLGQVYVRDLSRQEQPWDDESSFVYQHGHPILDLQWMGNSTLVLSDSGGGVHLLHNEPPIIRSQSVAAAGAPTVALGVPSDGSLVGLRSDGDLFVSCPPFETVSYSVNAPRPPTMGALVHLVPMPASDSFAYPSGAGQIVLWAPERSFHVYEAHRGPFYALFPLGEGLVSVGAEDALLKLWPPGLGEPLMIVEAPEGVLSGTAIPNRSGAFVLVKQDGVAGIYELDGSRLRCTQTLACRDCRVAVSLPPHVYRTLERQWREGELARLETVVREGWAHEPTLKDALRQMDELGGTTRALALQADIAIEQGDEPEALRHLLRLCSETDDISMYATELDRAVALLTKAWQPELALKFLDRYPQLAGPTDTEPAFRNRLVELASVLRGDNFVIGLPSDTPIETLIRFATAVGAPLRGRFMLNELQSQAYRGFRVSAERLPAKYQILRGESRPGALPDVEQAEIHWLSDTQTSSVETLVFRDDRHPVLGQLEILVHDTLPPLDSLLTAAVVFHPPAIPRGEAVDVFNERVARRLRELRSSNEAAMWIENVEHALGQTLWRLHNELR